MNKRTLFTLTGTSKATSGQGIIGSPVVGLQKYDWFMVDAQLVGATGGTLNLYLQKKIATDVWLDWAAFPQLAGSASAIKYSFTVQSGSSILTVGKTDDLGTTGAPALAAGTFVGGHPGDTVRLVGVAGSGTSVGAAVTVYLSAFKSI